MKIKPLNFPHESLKEKGEEYPKRQIKNPKGKV